MYKKRSIAVKFRWLRVLILSVIFASGCATPVHKSFSKLHIGDDKSIVLEVLGNPKHSIREDGKDVWVYRYYRDGAEYKRTLHFDTSKLSYLGEEEQVVDPRDLLIENDLESMAKEK